jgi:hypothetical protein
VHPREQENQQEIAAMSILRKTVGFGILISAVLAVGLALAADAKLPSGSVSLSEESFALIAGGSKGSGTLTFKGKEHPFKLKGLSVGISVGISKMSAAGEVYDLVDVAKFPGTYTKLDASIALGGGVGGLRLKNENGVIMRLESRVKGAELNLGSVSGITVTMD